MRAATNRIAYALRHGDVALLAAAVLFAVAAAVYWGGSAGARAQIEQLRRQAAGARQAQQADHARARREALSPQARLDEFYRFFPPQASAPDGLEKIQEAAARQGVQLAQGDYRLVRGAGGLLAYQASYPLKGGYAQLRKFLAQVLRDVPNASLDDLSLRRDAVGQSDLQATVRLTLYLKEPA